MVPFPKRLQLHMKPQTRIFYDNTQQLKYQNLTFAISSAFLEPYLMSYCVRMRRGLSPSSNPSTIDHPTI